MRKEATSGFIGFSSPGDFLDSSAGTQAIFTLLQGSNINIGFLNATDIDSSLGRPIYSYRGLFSNTLNWNLLPTDVTPKVNTFAS